ncbi:MAG: peptidylprolyl isomerase [Verrucomicrobiaceae bacterium]
MKFLPLVLLLPASPLSAQIYADVTTTMGDFTLELYHEDSPMTVANFISLADGSRAWIDSTTGKVHQNKPYFDGIIFHRVIKGFMNQVGSPKGDGSDGPGYNFPDEVDNGVLHDEPYLLSSANSGPHTNGSQLFITVDSTPWLDGIHTVFGKVSSGTDVIDAINQVAVITNTTTPVTEVSITTVTIRKVGAAAIAFDPTAQNLPVVDAIPATIALPETAPPSLNLNQPAGTSLNVSTSTNLTTWTQTERHLASGDPLLQFDLGEIKPREFFRTSLINWGPLGTFPSDLSTHIITINSDLGDFTLDLGDPSTLDFSGLPGSRLIDLEQSSISTDGFGATLLIYSDGLVPLRFRLGANLPIAALPTGRMTGTAFTSPSTPLTGTFTFTAKP